MIRNLDHFVLTVSDVEATCGFYHCVLNLEIITFGENRKALLLGQQKINLHQSGQELEPCAAYPTAGSADVCFITEWTLEDVQSHLEKCAVDVELGPVRRTGVLGDMDSLYFRDPDGNLIEISKYLNNS